ncbi:1-acyl-sn-glycerol-3-phosphate acyltransferase [Breznakiellaceae bacterium SP9]
METLTTAFSVQIKEVLSFSHAATVVTEQTVYQTGNKRILPYLDDIVERYALPGSGVDGMEHLEDLLDKAQAGKSCLLLLEHYSNLDLSIFSLLVRKASPRGAAIADAIVAIAGMKLTEDNPVVAAFASAYTRLVICPSRTVQALDAVKDHDELVRLNGINRAAMKTLIALKTKGKLVLVFPSGTRFRPWDPSTKKGVREIDSYIKSFDYMCLVALNGELLTIRRGDMMDDEVRRDIVRVTAGPVLSCSEFRNNVIAAAQKTGTEDKKQATVDAIMLELEAMHQKAEEIRQKKS